MIKLLTVIGARPQIIKAAAISRMIHRCYADLIEESILHTGQHYDDNMSQVFFDELGIPTPDYNLGVGSGRHGEQTAKMIVGIENILLYKHFDGVILYGDTNSTLAGAVAASKFHVPVFHVEAGLRSFNMAMPEEINRIVCDQLSSVLFPPTETAYQNLLHEGFVDSMARFNNGKSRVVVKSGDVMYDNSLYFASMADKNSNIITRFNLESNNYILATIHRDNNTDDTKRLTSIFSAIIDISTNSKIRVVIPLHPRTSKVLNKNVEADVFQRLQNSQYIQLIPPASFFDILVLEKNAKIVMTDSGGIQKEAFFFEKPCIIFRPETEWTEIVNYGAGIIADADYQKIINAYYSLVNRKVSFPLLFGDANAAKHILDTIISYLNSSSKDEK